MHMIQKESMTLMVSSSERFGKQIVQIIQIISQNEALAYLVLDQMQDARFIIHIKQSL